MKQSSVRYEDMVDKVDILGMVDMVDKVDMEGIVDMVDMLEMLGLVDMVDIHRPSHSNGGRHFVNLVFNW